MRRGVAVLVALACLCGCSSKTLKPPKSDTQFDDPDDPGQTGQPGARDATTETPDGGDGGSLVACDDAAIPCFPDLDAGGQ